MAYRVFSGPKGSPDISPLEKQHLLYKEFGGLDEALAWSRHVVRDDRVVLLLEGDDGTRLDRRQVAEALGVGRQGDVGK